MKDETVQRKTGRALGEWFGIIQKAGLAGSSHSEIAEFLHENHKVSSWWAQEITVLYEKHIGRRTLGQTQDGLYQIGVSKTVSAPVDTVWKLLQSSWGISLLTASSVIDLIGQGFGSVPLSDGFEALKSLDAESVSGNENGNLSGG